MENVKKFGDGKSMGYFYFIAFVAALGGGLYGYDTAVISGTISMVVSQFRLTASMEGTYVGCALLGSIAGVLLSGLVCDRAGRKRSLIVASILYTVSAIGCAVSDSLATLVAFRVIGGVGIGISAVVAPAYISEIAPARHRGRLVSLYQLAITVGFLAAYVVNYLILLNAHGSVDTGGLVGKMFVGECWRGMLFAETVPALLFVLLLFFIPESPVWLSMRGGKKPSILSDLRLVSRPPVLGAVIIGAAISILGQFMGVNAVLYYGPSIFEKSGLASGDSLFCQVLVGLVNVLTTVIAFFIIDKVGRKRLVYFGVTGMIVTLLGIAWYFRFGQAVSNYVLLVFFLAYVFFSAISICAVIFVLLSEMFPSKVRGVAMSIAELALWIGTWLIGQLTPVFLEVLKPHGTFLMFAIICVPYILIVWKLIPETTGKSLEEIEAYWYRGKK